VAPTPEPDLASRAVRALGHGVPVQREPVRLDVDIARAVVWVPGVVERLQLGLGGGAGRQQVGADGLVGKLPDAVHPPHVVVLVVEESVPVLGDQGAVEQVGELKEGEHCLQDMVGELGSLHDHGDVFVHERLSASPR